MTLTLKEQGENPPSGKSSSISLFGRGLCVQVGLKGRSARLLSSALQGPSKFLDAKYDEYVTCSKGRKYRPK